MNPEIYNSLNEFCYPVDHEYDPLTGAWTHQESEQSSAGLWLMLIATFAACVLYLASVWSDLIFIL